MKCSTLIHCLALLLVASVLLAHTVEAGGVMRDASRKAGKEQLQANKDMVEDKGAAGKLVDNKKIKVIEEKKKPVPRNMIKNSEPDAPTPEDSGPAVPLPVDPMLKALEDKMKGFVDKHEPKPPAIPKVESVKAKVAKNVSVAAHVKTGVSSTVQAKSKEAKAKVDSAVAGAIPAAKDKLFKPAGTTPAAKFADKATAARQINSAKSFKSSTSAAKQYRGGKSR